VRKADAKKRCDRFVAEINDIQDRARRVRQAQRVLGRAADKRWAFEMLAVNAVTAWSEFAEDIFYAGINWDSSALSRRLGLILPEHLSLALCEALFTTRGFLDFRSVGELKGEAKKYIGKRHAFASLPSASGQIIDRLVAVRNYVVHRSRVARSAYKSKVLEPEKITTLVDPGRFLLALRSGRSRLEGYLESMRIAGRAVKIALPRR